MIHPNDFTGTYKIIDNGTVEFAIDLRKKENSVLRNVNNIASLCEMLLIMYPACRTLEHKFLRPDHLVLIGHGEVNLPERWNEHVTDVRKV